MTDSCEGINCGRSDCPCKQETLNSSEESHSSLNSNEGDFTEADWIDVRNFSERVVGEDGNYYDCDVCHEVGKLLCCDTCPSTFHLECLDPPLERAPSGVWQCQNCWPRDDSSASASKSPKQRALFSRVKHSPSSNILSLDKKQLHETSYVPVDPKSRSSAVDQLPAAISFSLDKLVEAEDVLVKASEADSHTKSQGKSANNLSGEEGTESGFKMGELKVYGRSMRKKKVQMQDGVNLGALSGSASDNIDKDHKDKPAHNPVETDGTPAEKQEKVVVVFQDLNERPYSERPDVILQDKLLIPRDVSQASADGHFFSQNNESSDSLQEEHLTDEEAKLRKERLGYLRSRQKARIAQRVKKVGGPTPDSRPSSNEGPVQFHGQTSSGFSGLSNESSDIVPIAATPLRMIRPEDAGINRAKESSEKTSGLSNKSSGIVPIAAPPLRMIRPEDADINGAKKSSERTSGRSNKSSGVVPIAATPLRMIRPADARNKGAKKSSEKTSGLSNKSSGTIPIAATPLCVIRPADTGNNGAKRSSEKTGNCKNSFQNHSVKKRSNPNQEGSGDQFPGFPTKKPSNTECSTAAGVKRQKMGISEFPSPSLQRTLPPQPRDVYPRKTSTSDFFSRFPMPNAGYNHSGTGGVDESWSNKELDSLWIGVRKYSQGNWLLMLTDPNLCFSRGKTAADLAKRWEKEKAKHFSPQAATTDKPIYGKRKMIDIDLNLEPSFEGWMPTESSSGKAKGDEPKLLLGIHIEIPVIQPAPEAGGVGTNQMRVQMHEEISQPCGIGINRMQIQEETSRPGGISSNTNQMQIQDAILQPGVIGPNQMQVQEAIPQPGGTGANRMHIQEAIPRPGGTNTNQMHIQEAMPRPGGITANRMQTQEAISQLGVSPLTGGRFKKQFRSQAASELTGCRSKKQFRGPTVMARNRVLEVVQISSDDGETDVNTSDSEAAIYS